MAQTYVASFDDTAGVKPPNLESARSGVSWGAILAGGVTAAGVSIILLALGAGFGFASLSPYASDSMTVTGLAVGAAAWLIVVQWIAAVFGGYIAGRLRTKWADPHSDEVFFRDTAHGLLAWAVATLVIVAVFASGALGVIGAATSGAATIATQVDDTYFADQLFRAPTGGTSSLAPAEESLRTEGASLIGRSLAGAGTDADKAYLAQVVSARTGMAPADAQQRVDQVMASAKAAADAARKASATAALMTAFALLVGAFIAAVAGALGGKYRDELPRA